ncbi:MAG: thiamine phosphate synthase [Bacteroidetes bacterium]|nr:thiamine phosphate synthase [Bacteroidota bacterium]
MTVGKLHLLTDTRLQSRWSHLQLVRMAVSAGADVVQYREKTSSLAEQTVEVRSLLAAVPSGNPTRILVNDHLSVALDAGAHGVHLGLADGSPAEALRSLPPGCLVGATVHSLQELEPLLSLPISYIGVGPVFGTTSKNTGLPPLGLAGLRHLCKLSPFPVIAIGSITADNLPQVMDTGAHGVAILSEFCLAPHPEAAAAHLLHLLEPYR